MNARFALSLVGSGLLALWALAVIALVLGRYTPLALLSGVQTTVAVGAVVFTLFGVVLLVWNGYRRVVT
ncbi:hypothetical protein EL22_20545 [Halostagnicola sp. A56]|uniref:hypothetical protein n=1 Tax=Halostagnicola sp. A56 TaxID=1495067 RepID=UPI00049F8C41|nr:hypothetical protein [Halostagnicola sp. A56]KDE59550.1 hypothetical protein EL22_20545 [Halostagnicola sp. A56]